WEDHWSNVQSRIDQGCGCPHRQAPTREKTEESPKATRGLQTINGRSGCLTPVHRRRDSTEITDRVHQADQAILSDWLVPQDGGQEAGQVLTGRRGEEVTKTGPHGSPS